jgi:Caspase domain
MNRWHAAQRKRGRAKDRTQSKETPMHVVGRLRLALLGLLLLAVPEPSAADEKRVALVVGNAAYRRTAELKNPGNDAADMALSLKSLGFRVIDGPDLDKASMDARIREFALALAGTACRWVGGTI